MPEFTPEPFDQRALQRLTGHLPPSLFRWAIHHPLIRKSAEDNRLIRDLAAIQALGKTLLAKGRLHGFEKAISRKYSMDQQYFDLHYRSPREMAGTAAGQLAVAKLLTVWYGLEPDDLRRLDPSRSAFEYASLSTAGLQEAVCTAPKELGIADFTARDVYLAADFTVQRAVGTNGPDAIWAFVDFPHYPINRHLE